MMVSKRERANSVDVFLKDIAELNEGSSIWKYIIGALLIIALIAGYIYYNNVNSQSDKPQIEKANYQDYFDK